MKKISLGVILLCISVVLVACVVPQGKIVNETTITDTKIDNQIVGKEEKQTEIINQPIFEGKISKELKDIIVRTNLKGIHLIIQFKEVPPPERENLTKIGIIFHDYIRNNSWKVSVPINMVYNLTHYSNINVIREIPIQRKLIYEVATGEYHDWAKHEDGDVNLDVVFFTDVSKEKADELLKKYNAQKEYIGDISGYGPGVNNYYQVKISPSKVRALAEEDEVNYIAEAIINIKPKIIIEEIRECPNVTSVNCMPEVSKENIPYCDEKNRGWIEKNCKIRYYD